MTGRLKQQAPSAVKPCLKKNPPNVDLWPSNIYTIENTYTHLCVHTQFTHTHTNTRKSKTQKQVSLFNTRSLDESSELNIAFALAFLPTSSSFLAYQNAFLFESPDFWFNQSKQGQKLLIPREKATLRDYEKDADRLCYSTSTHQFPSRSPSSPLPSFFSCLSVSI